MLNEDVKPGPEILKAGCTGASTMTPATRLVTSQGNRDRSKRHSSGQKAISLVRPQDAMATIPRKLLQQQHETLEAQGKALERQHSDQQVLRLQESTIAALRRRVQEQEETLEVQGKALEMLRNNVQYLASCCSTAANDLAQQDPNAMITLVVGGSHSMRAHRFLLTLLSPVFEKMFGTDMIEKDTGRVLIKDASIPAMEAVVKYCYMADITFNDDNHLEEVTYISHKYEIRALKEQCETALCNRFFNGKIEAMVELDEVLATIEEALKLANKYDLDKLRSRCGKQLEFCNRLVDGRTAPGSVARLMKLSCECGIEDVQNDIFSNVKLHFLDNLDTGKQIFFEAFKMGRT